MMSPTCGMYLKSNNKLSGADTGTAVSSGWGAPPLPRCSPERRGRIRGDGQRPSFGGEHTIECADVIVRSQASGTYITSLPSVTPMDLKIHGEHLTFA